MTANPPSSAEHGTDAGEMPHSTRQLLLEHAAAVFAERGYHDATVRDICGRAGASLCLVNYHFQDKLGLYRAVLSHLLQLADTRYPLQSEADASLPAADRLRLFIQAYILRIFDSGMASWYGRIIAREMVQPSGILDEVAEHDMKPRWLRLRSIISELTGRPADDLLVGRITLSVYGQVLIYHNCRPVIQRLGHPTPAGRADIDELIDYITRFTLSAIEGLKRAGPAT